MSTTGFIITGLMQLVLTRSSQMLADQTDTLFTSNLFVLPLVLQSSGIFT